MIPAAAANDSAVFLVRNGGDRAGVDDITIAVFVKLSDFVALLHQQTLHSLGLILIGFATERIESKFHCEFHQ